ncbi:hypothetical protein B0F90DRAFT_728351 [Multifurca ochricompacta]|uniref:SET domain-containing protein n=1 Tax=Multifurca ochricompacta TaxID=376703 RepID=A0AAD4MBS6_9AGAM|nr:hypothetical protein B0F90DRAFT_728351 [Multifurca ochricompacta]
MRRGFLRMPLSPIQPSPVPTPEAALAPTLVPIPDGHIGCCERVGLSELLKILRNAGESTPSPQPVIFQVPPKATQPNEITTTCITIPETREKLLSKGPYPPINSSEGCRIRVVDVPGKGKGCVSTSVIPRGALIIRERPLVIAPTVMAFPGNFDRTVARAMPPGARAALLSLNNCYEDKVIGVLRTNNWGIGALPGHDAPYGGTGAIISRINHSCAPNALFRWNEDMFAAEVRALRPIARGEEVTMCYVPELEGYASRQARLRDAYGFTCTCELCMRAPPVRALSDHRRSQLEGLTAHYDELPDGRVWAWARDVGAPDDALLGALEEQAVMMERELYVRPEGWLTVARPLVKIYCALGNTVAARRWAVCAASYTRAATGTDGGWEAVARVPEQTIWWGARAKTSGR